MPHRPPSLLVSFDPLAAQHDANAVAPCPVKASDRQMLSCLHAFASHHLKAIQASDARYHAPVAYDVTEVVEDAAGGDAGGDSVASWLTPRLSTAPPAESTGGGRSSAKKQKFNCPTPPQSSRRRTTARFPERCCYGRSLSAPSLLLT